MIILRRYSRERSGFLRVDEMPYLVYQSIYLVYEVNKGGKLYLYIKY